MTPTEDARPAAAVAEVALHRKVKAIVMAEGVEYTDALERVWYAEENAEQVEAYRGFSCDNDGVGADETLSPFDGGLETGKRVRAHLSQHKTTPQAALAAVLADDPALAAAYNVGDLNHG